MCGIVGLFAKSPEIEERLGEHLAAMLVQMSSRGPDSAGVAVYRDPAPTGSSKLTLYSADPRESWAAVRECAARCLRRVRRAVGAREPRGARRRGRRVRRRGVGAGESARPARDERGRGHRDLQGDGAARRSSRSRSGSRTSQEPTRSATRAWRPRAASPPRGRIPSRPASTSVSSTTARSRTTIGCARISGARGSSSRPRTTPRSPPAISRGGCARVRALEQALEGCLDDLDGFYTFAVGTADGFAVLRDPIACKPAVLAETDDWVAMASEWRSIAVLPGAADAQAWEPEPGVIYAWEKALVLMAVRALETSELEVVDLADDVSARAQPAAARPRRRGCRTAALSRRQSERCARRCVRSGRRRRGRDRRARGLLLRRHEQARDGARARKREHRHRREHDVRSTFSSTGT